MTYALVLALFASTALTVGLYLMKREAERLPSLSGGWRLTAWWAFVRDPWWMLGLGLQIVGYAFYLVALRNAPLSIVHTILDGGIALFVIMAVVGLGERPRPIEWLGVCTIILALLLLGASLSPSPVQPPHHQGMVLFSLGLTGLAGLAMLGDRAPQRAIGLSVASGLILGLASVYAKALAGVPSFSAGFHSVYLLLTLAANLVGFVFMQAALQAGRGVVVMPLFSVLSNLVPVVGGILIFGEALPERGAAAVLRPTAFTLAILGAALLAGFSERAGAAPVAARPQAGEARSR